MAASATFALKAGVWFRRGRLLMVSPDSLGTACPLSGRNSTYRPVQISGAGSVVEPVGCLDQRRPVADLRIGDANAVGRRAEMNLLPQLGRHRRRRDLGRGFGLARRRRLAD